MYMHTVLYSCVCACDHPMRFSETYCDKFVLVLSGLAPVDSVPFSCTPETRGQRKENKLNVVEKHFKNTILLIN